MSQMSLFALDTDDMSNVGVWGAEDFERFLQDGDPVGFEKAMTERGFDQNVINSVMRARANQWRDIIDNLLRLKDAVFGPFVFGSSEKAIQANLESPLMKEIIKSKKNTSMHETVSYILREHVKNWVGKRIWGFTQLNAYDSPEKFLHGVASVCRFLEIAEALHAEEIMPEDVRLGDELIAQWNGTLFRGWVVRGTLNPHHHSLSYEMWVRGGDGFEEANPHMGTIARFGANDDGGALSYGEWMATNELTQELTSRYIRSFYHVKRLYRVGHTDDLAKYMPTKKEVADALNTLPVPETPELLWKLVGHRRDNWLDAFFHDDVTTFWRDYMTRYTPEDARRVILDSSCKVSRRGSRYDNLPPDEMIEPMVEQLVQATTIQEVDAILGGHYWITKETFRHDEIRYTLHSINGYYGCYDQLNRSAIAQTTDRDLILLVMRHNALNAHMYPMNVAMWTPDQGLQMCPPRDDATEEEKAKHIEGFASIQTRTCLGLWDRTLKSSTEIDEIEEEDDSDEEELCNGSCDFEDEDDYEDEE